MPRPGRFNPGKRDPVPIVQEEDGWAPGSVLTDMVNLASTGIGSPDHPGRSKSLYRLSYRGPPPLVVLTVEYLRICT
jgi:hypothetical protein